MKFDLQAKNGKQTIHLAHETGGTYERQDYYLVPVRKSSGDTYYEIRVNNMWVHSPHFPTTDEGADAAMKYAEQYIRAHPKPKGKKMTSEIGPDGFHKEMERRMKKLANTNVKENIISERKYHGGIIYIYEKETPGIFGTKKTYGYKAVKSGEPTFTGNNFDSESYATSIAQQKIIGGGWD